MTGGDRRPVMLLALIMVLNVVSNAYIGALPLVRTFS